MDIATRSSSFKNSQPSPNATKKGTPLRTSQQAS
jgi:hypothetical protein